MNKPKFEVELTIEQFDIFMAALGSIHRQMRQGKNGEINLLDNFAITWSSELVKFEVKANEV